MNRTLKYKLDIPGIIALVISVIIMTISNLLLSSIWTEQIKEVYFDTVICVCASLFGPFIGLMTGFLGSVCGDIIVKKQIVFSDGIIYLILGYIIGSFANRYGIREGRFKGEKCVVWFLVNAIGTTSALFFLKPFVDRIIYDKDMFMSLRESGMVTLVCTVPLGIVLTILFHSISKSFKKRTKINNK